METNSAIKSLTCYRSSFLFFFYFFVLSFSHLSFVSRARPPYVHNKITCLFVDPFACTIPFHSILYTYNSFVFFLLFCVAIVIQITNDWVRSHWRTQKSVYQSKNSEQIKNLTAASTRGSSENDVKFFVVAAKKKIIKTNSWFGQHKRVSLSNENQFGVWKMMVVTLFSIDCTSSFYRPTHYYQRVKMCIFTANWIQ